jgi:cytochrome c5
MQKQMNLILAMAILVTLLVAACAPAATPTPPPAPTPTEVPPTEAPTPTEVPAATEAPAAPEGKSLVESRCSTCHPVSLVETAKKTEAEWQATVERMVASGAQLNQTQQELVIKYLAETYPK